MPLGEIPDFAKKIATTRSRSVATTVLFQSLPALKERYPNDAYFGILGNTDISVFLGTTDQLTADFVSKRGGETSVLVESHMESHNKFDITRFTAEFRESSGVGKRMILTPDEVLTMGKDNPLREIIIMKDQPILMCEKFDFTRDPASKRWEPFSMNDFNPRDAFWFDADQQELDAVEDEISAADDEPVHDAAIPIEADEPETAPKQKPKPDAAASQPKESAQRRSRKRKQKDTQDPIGQQSFEGYFSATPKKEEYPEFLTKADVESMAGESQERWTTEGENGYKNNGVGI